MIHVEESPRMPADYFPRINLVKYSLLKSNISNITPLTLLLPVHFPDTIKHQKCDHLVSKDKVKVKTARATVVSTLG